MRLWQIFWAVSLLVAGSAFAFITFVVALKGLQDLRSLFRRLHEQEDEE